MGVQGLLQKVKSVVQQVHLSDFEGQTLAIDGASWLHKGVLSCAAELERGETTEAFLNYPLAMVETMRSHGVTPLMVFDGGILLAKSAMHRQRAETRTRNRQMAADLDGTEGAERRIDAALRKAVGVTPEITRRLITELRARGVHYLVAPYEADPQLAFLVREGYASAAVSEDSDMLPYGCARVLFKLSRETARADLIELDDLQAVEENGTHLFDGAWDGEWPAWREGLLRSMCVLAGTDYLASLPQVGIVKAHAAVRKHRQLHAAACELARAQRLDPAAVQEYARRAEMAQLVFSHQLVYDPATECVWPLSPLPPGMMLPQSEMEELFGRMLEPALARSICREATVNPINHRPYDLPPSPPIAMLLRPAPPLAGGLARRDGAAATAVARALAGSAAGEAAWPSGPSGAAVAGAAAGAVAGAVAGASAWPGLARVGVGVARVGVTPNVAAAAAVVAAARAASAAAGSGAVGVAAAAVVGARGAAENALCSDSTWEAMKLGGGVNAAHAVNAISGPHAPAFNSAGMGAGVLLAEAAHAVSAKRPREDCDRVEARVLQAPGFVLVGCAGRAGEDVWGGGERGVGEEIIPSEDAHGLVVTGGEGCNTGRGGDARLSKACSSAANGLRGGGAGGAGVSSERGSAPDMSQGREVSSKGSDAPWPDGFGGVAGGPNLWWAVAEWAAATGEHRLLQVLSRDCDDSLLAGGTPTGAQVASPLLIILSVHRARCYSLDCLLTQVASVVFPCVSRCDQHRRSPVGREAVGTRAYCASCLPNTVMSSCPARSATHPPPSRSCCTSRTLPCRTGPSPRAASTAHPRRLSSFVPH
jgi:exonuclease-1